MSNIFLFIGENDFAIRTERLRWVEEFARKHGADAVIRREGASLAPPAILDEIAVGPFLSAKRLVVLDGIPKLRTEDFEALVGGIHSDTLLLLVHRKSPGRRLSLPKTLPDACTVRSFADVKSKELREWAVAWAAQHGARLPADAAGALFACVGEDQEALAGEIVKLAGAADGIITVELVAKLAVPSSEGVVWRLTDDVCAGRRADALRYARHLQERGADAFGMWALLLSMLKNLVVVAAAHHDGKKPQEFAQQFGIHPFAVRSLLFAARRVDMQQLRAFVDDVTDADIALKTGGYRATDDGPQELQGLIDRFIATCP